MKRIYFITILFIIWSISKAQEFSTKIYFQDAKMHYDTLTIGYDQNATDSIDQLYGEIDINGTPFDSVFEVHATDQYKLAFKGIPYLVKKQIVNKDCEVSKFPFVTAILVKCKYYPLKIKWDKVLFDNACRNYSLITDWNPGGWFDAGGGQISYLKDKDSVTILNIQDKYNYQYSNALIDTVRLLYFTIASNQNFTSNSELKSLENEIVSIYPTLTNNKLFIRISPNYQIDNISFMDLNGRFIFPEVKNKSIDVSSYHPGIYVVSTKIRGVNKVFTCKIIKF
jgi:hypothetical protein